MVFVNNILNLFLGNVLDLDVLGLKRSEFLHVGDHFTGDVEAPISAGTT
jgi:hypothetical protein